MKTKISKLILLGGMILGCASYVSAATTFSFLDPNGNGTSIGESSSSTIPTQTIGGITMNVIDVWSTGSGNFQTNSWIGDYAGAGLAVCNFNEQTGCSSPGHQIDNNNGYDFVLFQFSTAVSLQSIVVKNYGDPSGGTSTDVDLSYAAMSLTSLTDITSKTWSGTTFTTINNGSGSSAVTDNIANSGASKYWLIGAAVTNTDGFTDAFKIQSITVAPEPTTFLMIGSGLIGAAFLRRRKMAKANS